MQVTGAYSISGSDLRSLLALHRSGGGGAVPQHCSLLLRMLCSMARHEGPSAFFDFSDPGAGLVRNSALR